MAQNNIEGSKTIAADGTTKLTDQPYPLTGTVTLHVILTGWNGTLQLGLIGHGAPDGTTPVNPIYQTCTSNTDVSSGTAITATGVYYVRLDGTRLVLTTTDYVAGSATVYWTWSQG